MSRSRAWVVAPLGSIALAALVAATGVRSAQAQIAISSNDNKVTLDNGVVKVVPNPPPDTVTILDLKTSPPKIIADLKAPGSVVGPPFSVAITPDQSLALVTAPMKVDPADPTKQTPDNRMSIIDLKASPPAVIGTQETGKSPAGVSINPKGTLALVANRSEGTVSVFSIKGKTVAPLGKVTLGDDKTGVSDVAITPDGKTALVTRDGDHMVSVLSITDNKVEYTKRDMSAGIKPYGIDITPDGAVAVVANTGRGNGDNDTISVVDLKANPPRVVANYNVGQTPEGIILSPDGKYCAVAIMNGSNKAKESPFFAPRGKLMIYRLDGTTLVPLAAAWTGHWSQGVAFTPDGQSILVQNMVEREIWIFHWDGTTLKDTGQRIKMSGGPAAIRTSFKH
jgi:WD40 repeat protein